MGYNIFMELRILLKQILLIIILVSIGFFSSFIFSFLPKEPAYNGSKAPALTPVVLSEREIIKFGLPVRLKIPAINVDSVIETVGFTPEGEMDIPKGPDNAAWFEFGPRPGEIGSAVIAGHYGWKNNIPAVFDDLNKLKKGDKLYIEDDKGAVITFIVRESRIYGKNEDVSGVFGSKDMGAHLNLVTCEGAWNDASKSYSGRLVVFTDRK